MEPRCAALLIFSSMVVTSGVDFRLSISLTVVHQDVDNYFI